MVCEMIVLFILGWRRVFCVGVFFVVSRSLLEGVVFFFEGRNIIFLFSFDSFVI